MDYGADKYGRDSSFTIPKKKENFGGKQFLHRSNSVLANAYGNIPNNYYSSQYSDFKNQPTHSWQDFLKSSNMDSGASTPEPTNSWLHKSSKRTWTDANSSRNSVTPATTSYKDTFGDLYDATLPKDLLELFQPLYCKLCLAQLSSNVMAKTHYKSKNHDKKVRTWLTEHSEKTGEPLHKRATIPRPKKEEENDPKYYHCDVCDLDLTGKIHAESHYMGKNHQRALQGKKNPAGKGYYNEEGKWVRTVAAKNDPTGRDGFGQDFVKKPIPKTPLDSSLRCETCDVTVTSIPQLEMHLQGQKHKKKLKHIEDGIAISQMNSDGSETGGGEGSVTSDGDILSSYRTPSGHFYCKGCNLSMNSEIQFMQHLKSKKHSRKLTSPTTVTDQPPTADDILMHL